jgi:phage repressor protein C with HTH and peptisase S24 domain
MVDDIALSAMRLQDKTCVNRTGSTLRFSHNGLMDIQWIRDGLKKPGKNQRGLASALGVDPSAVNRLLKGTRQLKAAEIEKAQVYFGLADEQPAFSKRPLPDPTRYDLPPLKVLGMAEGGPEGWFLFNGDVIDTIPRPANLAGAKDAYAVYISGTSMEPRYMPGELVHIHPGRPITIGAYVLIQKRSKTTGEPPLAVIKRLVRRSGSKITFSQHNPEKTFEIKADEILSMHRVVGSSEA